MRAVANDPEGALWSAGHIGAIQMQMTLAFAEGAMGGAQKGRVGEDDLRRQQPLAQQGLGAVDILENQVQQVGPLLQALLQAIPVFLCDEQGPTRLMVVGPRVPAYRPVGSLRNTAIPHGLPVGQWSPVR